jgi:glycosyltransferase involved in cell wall biosynthesis
MKVLLSAYACEPGKGSEPGVGWHWAIEIARLGHEVHVLTRASNRKAIEAAGASLPPGLSFHYYDLRPWMRFWKRGNRGLTAYYWLWQLGAARRAVRLHATERFDLVHHLTFGSIKLPTFMHRLGIPLVLGPLGGGETAPWPLRSGYSLRGKVVDLARDLSRAVARHLPAVRSGLHRAQVIALRTPENLDFIDASDRHKVIYVSDVGAPMVSGQRATSARQAGELRVLYVGRILSWKGLHLALEAVGRLRASGRKVTLSVIGKGPEEAHLRAMAKRLGIEDMIEWRGWMPQDQLAAAYTSHDGLLFPSLHDSGGSVVVEAIGHGLPVVCLDLGGPGQLVTTASGVKVPAWGRTSEEVAEGLAAAMRRLADDPEELRRLAAEIGGEARRLSWPAIVRELYETIPTSGQS